jgi:hypothetical protein
MVLHEVERAALGMPPGEGVALTAADVDGLLANPAYRASLGQPGTATHFRRSLPGGGGLHLVVTPQGAELHRDQHDPHGGPLSMLFHLATDSPLQALGTLAVGWSVLGRIGRREGGPRTGGE